MRTPFLACLILALFAAAAVQAAGPRSGSVVGVTDGDTLTVRVAGRPTKVRIAEIDAPEDGQPWGARAKQALSALAFRREVILTGSELDRYGRLIARLSVDGRDIGAEMVRSGNAWAYRDYLQDRRLLSLEREARQAGRGLWRLPPGERTEPWLWRKQSKHASAIQPIVATPLARPCGPKKYCKQMSSCAEAVFYLRQCRLERLDADGDGRPCESLCN